ncbi:MAG TPA: alpha/beta hydrolase [Syntrophorhabdaceae bacterium]|nr:alpha/beta hydrolase [Syntrophorhabdaceae bacterium]
MVDHRFIETNGIRMHIAEQGKGPLVILCHGFPECWYSWRHQLPAIASAGFHAVAPDQRGYGQSDVPEPVEAYHMLHLTGDIVGLVHGLGEKQAVIVGHDWGSSVAAYCALLRPDIFRAIALFSVPYRSRTWSDMKPTEVMRLRARDREFYQLYFQEPGKAERELESNVEKTIRMFFYSLSGDPPPEKRWRFFFNKSDKLLDTLFDPEALPSWLTEQDIAYYSTEFTRTGFRGSLNWYRNIDRLWELTPFLADAKIKQPALFIAGELDAGIRLYGKAFETLETAMPGLRKKALLQGAGHWIQQERPTDVSRLIVDFITNLPLQY